MRSVDDRCGGGGGGVDVEVVKGETGVEVVEDCGGGGTERFIWLNRCCSSDWATDAIACVVCGETETDTGTLFWFWLWFVVALLMPNAGTDTPAAPSLFAAAEAAEDMPAADVGVVAASSYAGGGSLLFSAASISARLGGNLGGKDGLFWVCPCPCVSVERLGIGGGAGRTPAVLAVVPAVVLVLVLLVLVFPLCGGGPNEAGSLRLEIGRLARGAGAGPPPVLFPLPTHPA